MNNNNISVQAGSEPLWIRSVNSTSLLPLLEEMIKTSSVLEFDLEPDLEKNEWRRVVKDVEFSLTIRATEQEKKERQMIEPFRVRFLASAINPNADNVKDTYLTWYEYLRFKGKEASGRIWWRDNGKTIGVRIERI